MTKFITIPTVIYRLTVGTKVPLCEQPKPKLSMPRVAFKGAV